MSSPNPYVTDRPSKLAMSSNHLDRDGARPRDRRHHPHGRPHAGGRARQDARSALLHRSQVDADRHRRPDEPDQGRVGRGRQRVRADPDPGNAKGRQLHVRPRGRHAQGNRRGHEGATARRGDRVEDVGGGRGRGHVDGGSHRSGDCRAGGTRRHHRGPRGRDGPGASQTAQSLAYAGISLNTAGQQLQAAAKMQGLAAVAGAGTAGSGEGQRERLRVWVGSVWVHCVSLVMRGSWSACSGRRLPTSSVPRPTPRPPARTNCRPWRRKQPVRPPNWKPPRPIWREAQRAAQSKAVGGRTIPQTVLEDIEQQKTRVDALTEALKAANEEYERMQVEGAIAQGHDVAIRSGNRSGPPCRGTSPLRCRRRQVGDPTVRRTGGARGSLRSPAGFPKDKVQKEIDAAMKKAKDAAIGGAKEGRRRTRKMFPAYRSVQTGKRVPGGAPLPRERPKEAPPREPEKKVEAAATTFAEALEKLRTTEPAWLETYKTATKETPAWMTAFKEASADDGTAGTKFAIGRHHIVRRWPGQRQHRREDPRSE